jgi:hypothetical protein
MADFTVDLSLNQVGLAGLVLVANTAKTVQFTADLEQVQVTSSGGTAQLYVAFVDANHPLGAAVPSAGTVTHCYALQPNTSATLPVRTMGNTLVSVISSGTPTVWVTAT